MFVIAGYLGAGKTTLLNHLLRNSAGIRMGVLVNDFGAINIDAMLVAGQVDSMVSLSNGCICCEVETEDISDAIGALADVSPRLDVIAVEASGVADPSALAQIVMKAADTRFHYAGMVLVVDAVEFRTSEVGNHVRFADLVVANKVDKVTDAEIDELRTLVRSHNTSVPIVFTTRGILDAYVLMEPMRQPDVKTRAHQMSFDELMRELESAEGHSHEGHSAHGHGHETTSGHQFQSVSWTTESVVHPRFLMDFFERRPAGVFRAKGVVHFGEFGDGAQYVVQLVGSSLQCERRAWPARGDRRTELVLIGHGMDDAQLVEDLNACVAERPGPNDEYAILRVLRYVEDDTLATESSATDASVTGAISFD
ncbi:GTP-binding protein [Hoyosella rhizosphaerae]|nr:GTP-binding protein [Hoyosella rhizosphaerae]